MAARESEQAERRENRDGGASGTAQTE